MTAIETHFVGPTNFKGSRIVAQTTEKNRRRIIVSCDDRLDIEDNHRAAAVKLIHKLGWEHGPQSYGEWYCGGTEQGYVFVCAVRYAQVKTSRA